MNWKTSLFSIGTDGYLQRFVKGMCKQPTEARTVHRDYDAKAASQKLLPEDRKAPMEVAIAASKQTVGLRL